MTEERKLIILVAATNPYRASSQLPKPPADPGEACRRLIYKDREVLVREAHLCLD